MPPLEIGSLTIRDLQRMYRSTEVSPVEVLEATVGSQAEWEPSLNAFITVLIDESRSQAAQAERAFLDGLAVGPLSGIPVTVKDLFYTKGTPTTCGSRILADFVPEYDATAVARLRDGGAILFGKTNALEFAYGTVHPDYGQCNNPWNVSRTAGGSSSGSAASVAAGIGLASLGTDTGGSVRVPASYCGIVGLKPTYGRISRYGVFPLSWTLDHVGPMARTVSDTAELLGIVAGFDQHDGTSSARPVDNYVAALGKDVAGLKAGLLIQHLGDDLEIEVQRIFAAGLGLLRDLGLDIVELEIDDLLLADTALLGVILPEASSVHERWLKEQPEDYALATRDQLELGAMYPAMEYLRAQRYRALLRQRIDVVLQTVDLLISPTVAYPAPDSDPIPSDPQEGPGEARRTGPFNLTGHPALTVPCGFTTEGIPVGMQLAGRAFDETTLFQVGHAFEQAAGWAERRPKPPDE